MDRDGKMARYDGQGSSEGEGVMGGILMAYDLRRGENYVNRYSENPVWGNPETVAEFIPIMKKSITSS